MQDVLEAISSVHTENLAQLGTHAGSVDAQKKAFVRVSKNFSETLKRYFKDGRKSDVLAGALRLVNQTNLVLRTIRLAVS